MGAVPDDQVWDKICQEAREAAQKEPALASFLYTTVLAHPGLDSSLSYILAAKLENPTMPSLTLRDLISEALMGDPLISESVLADLHAVVTRDPACDGYSVPLLFFKGFHSIQAYRVAHYYWVTGRKHLALFLQSQISEVFAVDIHPGAVIGRGIMFDHATSVVIGETTVIEDNFSMLHEVTLGGSGKECGDRHPKIGKGVMIGAGAKVLGNIKVGQGAKIGAGSVVLSDVAPHTTVTGVPAHPVGSPNAMFPALEMDQTCGCA